MNTNKKAFKKLSPVYLFYGESDFLLQEAVEQIVTALDSPGFKDFNLHKFTAKETPMGNIISSAMVSPMMAMHRLVIVREGDKLKENELEQLLSYTTNPVETTVLIVIFKKIDKRKSVFKKLSKTSIVREFKGFYEDKLPSWIEARAKMQGFSIDRGAAQFLVERVGTNLGELAMELEKLVLTAQKDKIITLAMVEATSGNIKRQSIFKLTDSIGERRIADAVFALNNLLLNGEPHQLVLFMITRHMRLLLKTKEILEKKGSQKEIAGAIGNSREFLVKKYIKQASNFTLRELKSHLIMLMKTDHKLKSNTSSPQVLLEELLFNVI